jgi:hypothetical protein
MDVLNDCRRVVFEHFIEVFFKIKDKSWIQFLDGRMTNAEKEALLLKSVNDFDFEAFNIVAHDMVVSKKSRDKGAKFVKVRQEI